MHTRKNNNAALMLLLALTLGFSACAPHPAPDVTAAPATAAPVTAGPSATAITGTDALSHTVVYGKVTSIDGKTAALALGTLEAVTTPDGTGTPPDGMGMSPDGMGTPPDGTNTPPDGTGTPPGGAGTPPGGAGAPPDGMSPGGAGGTPPEKPDGMPLSEAQPAEVFIENDAVATLTLGDDGVFDPTALRLGMILCIQVGDGNAVSAITVQQSGDAKSGSGVNTLTADVETSDKTYVSELPDENALRVEGGARVALSSITVTKRGDATNGDNSSFYGLNAGVLAQESATLTLENATVNTDAKGANAVFAYGEGTKLIINNSVLRTAQGNAGGVMAAGGAAIEASGLDIETQGDSSAAIRSDRGGGTIAVQGGSYVTHGAGSPAIYSTASIAVSNASLHATASEAVVVEGKNSVVLTDCDVIGTMAQSREGENLQTVMLYQSMSGDADIGRSSFSMQGGTLSGKSGDLFYVTNTACDIALSGVTLANATDVLLRVAGNASARGWGKAGENGGDCAFTAASQMLAGNILVDDISALTLTVKDGSDFTGAINPDGQAGTVKVTLAADSTWTLGADSYVSAFEGNLDNVDLNGYQLYIDGKKA